MKNLKIILTLVLFGSTQLHCMEVPPQPIKEASQAFGQFEQLPADVKRLIVPFIASGNVQEVANTILALNSTNRFFHNYIANPENLIKILDQMPRYTLAYNVLVLLEKTNLPGIKSDEIRGIIEWLHGFLQEERNEISQAIWDRNKQRLNSLLDRGYYGVNDPTHTSRTFLMLAARSGYNDIVQELLKHGANVNQQDNWGVTALMTAAEVCLPGAKEMEYYEVVKTLLEVGADLNLKNKKDEKAIDIARDKGCHRLVELLARPKHGLEQEPPLLPPSSKKPRNE